MKGPDADGSRRAPALGHPQAIRIALILAANAAVAIAALVFVCLGPCVMPDLRMGSPLVTMAVATLPASAAFGLMLGCRRIDLSLPMIAALAVGLNASPHFLSFQPIATLGLLCGLGAALAAIGAAVTWYGRISSALWTALVAMALVGIDAHLGGLGGHREAWSWPWALAASMGLLVGGAALLGMAGLVSPPNLPPILRAGPAGLTGLAAAWVLAAVAMVLAAKSELAPDKQVLPSYGAILAAGAMGGAYILRGRWGAMAAVLLTSMAHFSWLFAATAFQGGGRNLACILIPALVPLAVVPAYLVADRLIRTRTGESPATALMG